MIGILLTFQIAFATTYYSNNAELSNVNNWWTATNGSGSHPANFNTSGDIFQVQSGQICPVNNSWSLANGVNVYVFGTLSVTGSSIISVGTDYTSTGSFLVKSSGTFSNQTTGTISFHGTITIESGGTWTGSGATGNTININGAFTNSSASQIDNSTATYVFQNIGPRIYNAGLGFNVYNHTSSGLNSTYSGIWYVRHTLSTGAFQMNANAEMYIYGSFTASSDWSHCVSSSTLHYAANMSLMATQYGCKVQIDSGVTVSLTSGNFYNNSDFIIDVNSTVNVSGTGFLQYLHFVTMNAGSTLYINNGNVPNNFNTYTNVYSPTSTFRFGNNGSNYSYLLYSDKQVFGNLTLDNASTASTVNTFMQTTTIQGNLTIGTNVTFQPWTGFQYDLIIGGNLINNGSLVTSNTTIKNVTFNGTAAQDISGSSTTSFYNLIINNTSSTGVSLSKTAIVTNSLTLTDGVVYTSSSNILTLNNGATSTSGSDASHVDGPMKKIGNSAFIFPTGDNGIWARIGFSDIVGFDATTEISAEYYHVASPNSTNLGLGVHNVSKVEYWDISRVFDPLNDATCQVTMYFNNNNRSGISGAGTDIITTHYEGALWANKGGVFHDNLDGTGYIKSFTALTSYSPETISSTDGSSVLPIELIDFSAEINDNEIQLEWLTASESNNDFFTIYRSTDGVEFEPIAEISGAGNSSDLNSYNYNDNNFVSGISYYQLSQTDYDGTQTFSKIISVNQKIGTFTLNKLTNENGSILEILFADPSLVNTILITNNNGEIIYKNDFLKTVKTKIAINLPNGIYIMTNVTDCNSNTLKFIVR